MPVLPRPFSNQPLSNWVVQLQHAEAAEDRLLALQAVGLLAPPHETAHWAAHALRDADSTVRALAAKLLGSIGAPPSDETDATLVSVLDDSDPDLRFESARALIRTKSDQLGRAIPVLLAFMDEHETQPLMVAAIVNALVEADSIHEITKAELLPRMQRLLDHERAEVREAVATAFAKWPTMSVSLTNQLLPLLDDSEPIVREKIALMLGRAGIVNDDIRRGLESSSQDEDSAVARAAAEALQILNAKPSP